MYTDPLVLGGSMRLPPRIAEKFCNLPDLRLVARWVRLAEQGVQYVAVGTEAGISLCFVCLEMGLHLEVADHCLGQGRPSLRLGVRWVQQGQRHNSLGRVIDVFADVGG